MHEAEVLSVFNSHVKCEVEPIYLNVLDHTGMGKPADLVAALEECAVRGVDVINMSIGTQQYSDFAAIAGAVAKLGSTVIIAACANTNRLTFPACLPQVIGVRSGNTEGYAYVDNPYDGIEIIIEPRTANSLAAPRIAALVCEYLTEGVSPDNVRARLRSGATPFTPSYDFYKGLLAEWEDVNIPIVALSVGMAVPKALLNEFVADGYRAVCFSRVEKRDIENLVFHISGEDMNLHYNFTLPDIIFLYGGEMEGYVPDLTLAPADAGITLREIEVKLA
jgi:hypothetical protein